MKRLIIVAVLCFACNKAAYAMSCLMPENALISYEVVFKGKAISTVTLEEHLTAKELGLLKDMDQNTHILWAGKPQVTKFEIVENYKGPHFNERQIFHRSMPSVFGTSYENGETYIIYVNKDDHGQYSTGGSCQPEALVSAIKDDDKYFSQLTAFKMQADGFEKLIFAHPANPYYHFEQAKFYQSYADYAAAEDAYKKGMAQLYRQYFKNADDEVTDDKLYSYADREILKQYGTALYYQRKYNEALVPLKKAGDEESNKLYMISLIKLRKFDALNDLVLDLSGITLDNLDLSDAHLANLNLSGAKINGLILNNVSLAGTNFSGTKIRGLEGKNSTLRSSDFKNSEVSGNLDSVDFSNSDFSKARLYFNHVKEANFSGANFTQASFTVYQDILKTNMNGTNLEGAYIHKLTGVTLHGAKLNHLNKGAQGGYPVEWQKADLSGADLSGGDFRGADLRETKLQSLGQLS